MAGSQVIDTDRGYAALVKELKSLKGQSGKSVLVGIHGDEGSEIVVIAASNEFGTSDGHIPERSYLRSTIDSRTTEIADGLQFAVDKALDGGSLDDGLGLLGEEAVGWVKEAIRDISSPPNAPSTIAAKGSDNPLIDTGNNLRNRIAWKLEG